MLGRYSLLGIPISKKYIPVSLTSPPVSPGPPPYRSPQQSPNPNIHEIDSIHLHEVANEVPPSEAVQALRSGHLSHEMDSATVKPILNSVDEVVELPTPAGRSRWSTTTPNGEERVEIGDGAPRSRAATPVSAMQSPNPNGRDSTVSYDSPRSTIAIGMMQPNENESRREARDSYVGWQHLKP